MNDHSRWVWTLFALVVRMAEALGLHIHNPSSSLKPFELEMRRRLWNQICVLDINSSIDRGTEPIITDRFTSTLVPLNVYDTDLFPDMDALPPPREDFTDVSFCLMGNVEKSFLRSLVTVPRDGTVDDLALMSWQKKQERTYYRIGSPQPVQTLNWQVTRPLISIWKADLKLSFSCDWF